MGASETKEEQGISLVGKNYPLIQKKYRLVSVLGGGAFGRVYKIVDINTKKFFAMKTVPMSSHVKNVSKKQQSLIIKSHETERNLLSMLDNKNIVKFYDSFQMNRSPLEDEGQPKNPHLCNLLEFIKGSDLNQLLKKNEEQNFHTPVECTIHWFVKLLETLSYVHSKNIVHRDLKPDNILVSYESLDYEKMKLKISDFGVGKEISKGNLAREIAGQLFYTAPEVLLQSLDNGYDSRCDIWSLGILFLQVISEISIKTYQKEVQNIFKKVKQTPELREKFCKRYHIKSMEKTGLLQLLVFMHENELFYFIIEKFVKDEASRKILSKMICPYEKRLFANDLLQLDIIKTWKYILGISKKKPKQAHPLAVLTFLKILPKKKTPSKFYSKCINLLHDHILLDVLGVFQNDGILYLFKHISVKELYAPITRKDFFKKTIMILIKIGHFLLVEKDDKRFKIFIRSVTVLIRELKLLTMFKELLLEENSIPMYYFSIMMCVHCPTIAQSFLQFKKGFIMKINVHIEKYVLLLLEVLGKHFKKENILELLNIFKSNNIFFLKSIKSKLKNTHATEIIPRIYGKIEESKEIEEKEKYMLLLTYFVQDFTRLSEDKLVSNFVYDNPKIGKQKFNKIKLLDSNEKSKVLIHSNCRSFTCNFRNKDFLVELVSTEPVVIFKSAKKKDKDKDEKAIGYYELKVKNGGQNDDIFIGFTTEEDQILLHAESGSVGIFDVDSDELISIYQVKPLLCYSYCTIGVGLTNKGNVFFTRNNELITPFYEFSKVFERVHSAKPPKSPKFSKKKFRGGKRLYASVKLNGNKNFKGHINFGKKKFRFRFNKQKNTQKRMSKEESFFVNSVKEIFDYDLDCQIVKKVKEEAPKDSMLYKLCTNLLNNLGKSQEKLEDDFDEKLFKIYLNDGFDVIVKDIEESKVLIEDLDKTTILFSKFRGSAKPKGVTLALFQKIAKNEEELERNKKTKKKMFFNRFRSMNNDDMDEQIFGGLPESVRDKILTGDDSDFDDLDDSD